MSLTRTFVLAASTLCAFADCGFALETPATAPATRPATSPTQKISLEQFDRMRAEKDVVIVDVRSPAEFEEGHIAGAVNVPITPDDPKAFDEQVGKLDKSKQVLVHCAVGGRSKRAAARMEALGFAKLYDFTGGMAAWEKAGKPVEAGKPTARE